MAGLSAAYTLARAGVEVLVVERGDYPGSKSVMGGVVYRIPAEDVFPGFAKDAPIERPVTRQELWLMTEDSAVRAGYGTRRWSEEPSGYTVLRAKFDQWLSARCLEAGAKILTETTVTGLILERGRVAGVRTSRPEGDIPADVVVIAQGINRLLVEEAGLAQPLSPRDAAVAVKEVLSLPRERIEERFNIGPDEGVTIEVVGAPTRGMVGTGFLYTNRESLSIGVGAMVHQMNEMKTNPYELLQGFKAHPLIRRLIEGAEVKEYGARLIPEGGYKSMPRLYGNGVLVTGDSAMLCNGLYREGSNLAMISGKLAAETIIEARARGGYHAENLARYRERLEDSFILKDLRKLRNVNEFLENHRQFFTLYPKLLSDTVHMLTTVDMVPKKEKQRAVRRLISQKRGTWRMAGDLLAAWKTIG